MYIDELNPFSVARDTEFGSDPYATAGGIGGGLLGGMLGTVGGPAGTLAGGYVGSQLGARAGHALGKTNLPGQAGQLVGETLGLGDPAGPFGTDQLQGFDPAAEATQLGRLGQVGPVATGQDAQSRAVQAGLLKDLQAQAAGTAPSLAEAQMRAAQDRNAKQALSLAATAPGGNPALAMRTAQQQLGAGGQALARDTGMARLGEQMAARGQLGQVAGQMRSGDQALAGMQLGQQQFNADARNQALAAEQQRRQRLAEQRNQAVAQLELQRQGNNQQRFGQLLGAGAQGGSAGLGVLGAALPLLMSDEREKEHIRPAGKDLGAFLDGLAGKGRAYTYKDPGKPGAAEGTHYSVMAQDLEEAGPVGRSMVSEGADGRKRVDYARGFGALLAGVVDQEQRLKKLERSKGAR